MAYRFVAGRAAGIAAGAAASAASTTTARADARAVHVTDRHQHARKELDEEWLLTDLAYNKETLIFRPYSASEIDAALDSVTSIVRAGNTRAAKVVVHEEASDAESATAYLDPLHGYDVNLVDADMQSETSSGHEADLVIEQTVLRAQQHSGLGASTGARDEQMAELMQLTRRMLTRPGLQREVVLAMMEDEEVREIMLRQSHEQSLDAYLAAVGIHTPGLLPGPEGHPVPGRGKGGADPLQAILDAMARCIDGAGSALTGLGVWLRARIMRLGGLLASKLFGVDEEWSTSRAERQGQQQAGKGNRATAVLGAVMVVAVGVLCMLMVKRPVVLKVAGAAAVAGAGARAARGRSDKK